MRRNISLIMVFLFGCATAKMVEYVSFQDAVAKTKSRCHYTWTGSRHIAGVNGQIKYDEEAEKVLRAGFRVKLNSDNYGLLWEKCK